MNNYGKDNINPSHLSQNSSVDPYLEHRIARYLKDKADRVTFTPAMRMQVMQKLSHQRTGRTFPSAAVALALVVILLLAGALSFYLSNQFASPKTTSITTYIVSQTLPVAQPLAAGGSIISLDPTQQHFVYQPSSTSGTFYTANLADPLNSNTLAMRYAQTMNWSPDGSALIATVEPSPKTPRALALVPNGHFMHVIRPDTAAASWTPNTKNQLTFVTQHNGQTSLWSLDVTSNTTHLLTTLPLALPVQNILWSPDHRQLALITAASTQSTQSHAIFLMDEQTHTIHTLVSPASSTISTVIWSPNSQYLAYSTIDQAHHAALHVINPSQPSHLFSAATNQLQGWSWSPDSKNLLYSDAGTLKTYTTSSNHTTTLSVSSFTTGQLTSPFWLNDGRLVCLQLSHTSTHLVFLSPHTSS